MRSSISARGQTVVPAEIRRRLQLGPADRLEWIVEGKEIRVIPVHADPIDAFRGRGKGGATERLLVERRVNLESPVQRCLTRSRDSKEQPLDR